jgi:chromosome segregation ATPase
MFENIELRGNMLGKKGFFQKKSVVQTSENETQVTTEQMKKLGHQLMALKQKLAASEQENENLKLECDNLRHGQLKESKALLDKKSAEFEKTLGEQRIKLEQEMVEKNAKLQTAEIALQAEKDRFTKLTQELEDALSSKATEVKALTKEKLEIKSQVSEVLIELQEHFDYKTALLETERELLAQEKNKQETQVIQKIEACEEMMRQTEDEADQIIETAKATAQQLIQDAQVEIEEKQAQSKAELNRLKGRIDHYSTQINAATQTIDSY